jgi:hypothetical protein
VKNINSKYLNNNPRGGSPTGGDWGKGAWCPRSFGSGGGGKHGLFNVTILSLYCPSEAFCLAFGVLGMV